MRIRRQADNPNCVSIEPPQGSADIGHIAEKVVTHLYT